MTTVLTHPLLPLKFVSFEPQKDKLLLLKGKCYAGRTRLVHICSNGDHLELQKKYIEAIANTKKTVILYEHGFQYLVPNAQQKKSKFINKLNFRCETWDIIPELRAAGSLDMLKAKKLELQHKQDADNEDTIKNVDALIKYRELENKLMQTQARLRQITSQYQFVCKNVNFKPCSNFAEQSTRLQESIAKLNFDIKAHLYEIRHHALTKCIEVSLRFFDQVIVLSDIHFRYASDLPNISAIKLTTPPKETRKRPLIQPLESDLP